MKDETVVLVADADGANGSRDGGDAKEIIQTQTQNTAVKGGKRGGPIKKKTKEEKYAEKEEDSIGFGYFQNPQLVVDLWDELDPAK